MLADAKLPQKFWAETLSTAVYLHNRSPTKAVKGMTPFESWMGEKPMVNHLGVFGCTAYAHIPKDERQKFDQKSRSVSCLDMALRQKDIAYMIQSVNESSTVEMFYSMSLMLVLRRSQVNRKKSNAWNWMILEKQCMELDDLSDEEATNA